MNFAYPILILDGKELILADKESLRVGAFSFPNHSTLLRRARPSTAKKLRWLIEANGNFRDIEYIGLRREWARPLAFLWNFVREEYRMSTQRTITVGELSTKLDGIKDRFQEAPLGAELRRFLKAREAAEIVSGNMLGEYLGPRD